ncbi:hypothetical protein BVX98_00940 [bacterium F11]|nr:hypothetical protein BVX98_00940 [bacterium F11]
MVVISQRNVDIRRVIQCVMPKRGEIMKWYLILLFMLVSTNSLTVSAEKTTHHLTGIINNEFVGDPPDIVKPYLGSLLHYSNPTDNSYGVNVGENEEGHIIIVFKKFLNYERSIPKWKVIDAIRLPGVKEGDEFNDFCKPTDVDLEEWNAKYPQNFLVAFASFEQGEYETKDVKKAWAVNWDKVKLEEIPITDISCYKDFVP